MSRLKLVSNGKKEADVFGREPTGAHCTKTLSDQPVSEDAVIVCEIEQLPDLAGFLKLASRPEWRRVQLRSDAVR